MGAPFSVGSLLARGVFDGRLYVGTLNQATGGELWMLDSHGGN